LPLVGGLDLAANARALTRKARAMVAYLALQSGRSQSREKLAALLWGRNGEPQARTNLRQALSSIRRAMRRSGGDLLLVDGDRIILDLDDAELDVARFE
jgi:DNA-binding SARP family transcriptional activator